MRLLALKSGPEILGFLKSLDRETKAIIEDIATLAIYSGQSYDELWRLTADERKIFVNILKDKINAERGIKSKQVLTQGFE